MRILTTVVFLGLSSVALCQESGSKRMDEVFRDYRNCMTTSVRSFAKKASNAEEAIIASTSLCHLQRERLSDEIAASKVANDIVLGAQYSEYATNRHVSKVQRILDDRLKPELVRAYLEAK